MIFLLGVAGSGMRNLAFLLQELGETVAGTDSDLEALPAHLTARGLAAVTQREAGTLVKKADQVIYSDALPATDPLRRLARGRGTVTQSYSEAVAHLAQNHALVAVAGTHGKSSTTAMLAHILIVAGLDPTVLVGAPVVGWQGGGARMGKGELFIVEADEYRNHFLNFRPRHTIITNIDWDHPDFFTSRAAVRQSYAAWLRTVADGGLVVTLPRVRAEHTDLPWPVTTITAAPLAHEVTVSVPGWHMRDNAALAAALAEALGVAPQSIRAALATFPGVGRRFETIGGLGTMRVISDYGHHPTAIAVTLAAARQKFVGQRIAVLLEIHTLERWKQFRAAYISALYDADEIVLLPVFIPAGREKLTSSLEQMLNDMQREITARGKRTVRRTTYQELPEVMKHLARECDVALAFTAGKLDQQLRRILKM